MEGKKTSGSPLHGSSTSENDDWADLASQLLKDQMYWHRVNYKQLSRALEQIGVVENPRQLTNKINRGNFSFAFFLQCMKALGIDQVKFPWSPGRNGAAGSEDNDHR